MSLPRCRWSRGLVGQHGGRRALAPCLSGDAIRAPFSAVSFSRVVTGIQPAGERGDSCRHSAASLAGRNVLLAPAVSGWKVQQHVPA